jgi:quercetin dioxygenase-like cupin family protein
MRTTKNATETVAGPSDWFTGAVYIEPDEEHWHGAAPDRLMVHLALNEVDDEHPAAHWGEHVSDDEYNGAHADTGHE